MEAIGQLAAGIAHEINTPIQYVGDNTLITAEKELLEGTLKGCVSVLSEMLSFSNPAAFGRAMRLLRFVQNLPMSCNNPALM